MEFQVFTNLSLGRGQDDAAQTKFTWHLQNLEQQLIRSGGPWICGDQFTLAEICVAPIMDSIEYLERELLWGSTPAIAEWLERVKQLDSYVEDVHTLENIEWKYDD